MNHGIPFLSLGPSVAELRPEIDAAVARVLDSGWYLLGKELEAFEGEWAGYCGASHGIGLANGLDALRLALTALDVGPGDEVLVPAHTYIATWLAIDQVGATVVPVECDPVTCNLDPERLQAALTPRTKAILPVHLYGLPAPLGPIIAFARRHGLVVIEDAAQAHGAEYQGRRLGAHSDAVCWSFYPTKNLGALGDAGAVTTDRADLADRLRVLRNYGQRQRYICEEIGINSRMEEIHAAILRVKLRHLDAWNARRQAIADLYDQDLQGLGLGLPARLADARSAHHLYVVRSPRREALRTALAGLGIQAICHYPVPPHLQQAYRGRFHPGSFPIAETLADEVLSLPIGPHLGTEDATRIITAIRGILGG